MKRKAVLFKSTRRFEAFQKKLDDYEYQVTVLDFSTQDWIDYDYSSVDLIIYFPEFLFSSNSPQALYKVFDNLLFINKLYPDIDMFPDPNVIPYYSDKYRQFLFLKNTELPFIPTVPLLSKESLEYAADELGFPMVLKNRYGAGGDYVFLVNNKTELKNYFRYSVMDFANWPAFVKVVRALLKKKFWWYYLKAKKLHYPFFSFPLLAQKFVNHDHDLKTVTGFRNVIEAHWRRKSEPTEWKMNIDGGGIGEWSYVPDEPVSLSIELAGLLDASWLNIDFMCIGDKFYISEFSPVWHHYAYREKDGFVYKDNYNLKIPLERALDLEEIIVSSYHCDT